MTRAEERLRSALADAAETVRPGTLRPLTVPTPRRPRTGRWIVPLIAAASVGTLVADTGVVRGHARPVRPLPGDRRAGIPACVTAAERGVVKLTATAPGCPRRIEGTGFVYAPQRVMTAAHVVAGSRGPVEVSVAAGRPRYRATVVVYDPRRDVAVLAVPGLRAPALGFHPAAAPGAPAVIAGYPQGTSRLTATTAGIRTRRTATGPDLYRSSQVRREILSIRASAPAARCWPRTAPSTAWSSPPRSTTPTPCTPSRHGSSAPTRKPAGPPPARSPPKAAPAGRVVDRLDRPADRLKQRFAGPASRAASPDH